ncbi:lanthionine synthetase C family protein [Kitasatospora sp. NPDC093550]|uniref:lanthionine synthetase C family protein n=1 Tax=Kitasatospora sp. NPDC093550 TaxID=3364089 RepID=UPI003803A347
MERIESRVGAVARALADPEKVIRTTVRGGASVAMEHGLVRDKWMPLSLGNGSPGIALLFAELGHLDGVWRGPMHRYLRRALEDLTPGRPQGLHDGLTAVAFSIRCAPDVRSSGYTDVLRRLDDLIETYVREVIAAEAARAPGQRAGTTFRASDVISGVAGIARYLLIPGVDRRATLERCLDHLVGLGAPVLDGGTELPGWWMRHAPDFRPDGGGHLNFGMAHGVSGLLSVLSLARRQGAAVAGQDEAIEGMAEWLLAQSRDDRAGPLWPATRTRAEYLSGDVEPPPPRPSWCYGSPGIARALQTAGEVMGEPRWVEAAARTLRASFERLRLHRNLPEVGLCHGSAGLLHTAAVMNRSLGDDRIGAEVDALTQEVLAAADDRSAFGYRVRQLGHERDLDFPGFLQGAAGVALALHARTSDALPRSGWDRALLLA